MSRFRPASSGWSAAILISVVFAFAWAHGETPPAVFVLAVGISVGQVLQKLAAIKPATQIVIVTGLILLGWLPCSITGTNQLIEYRGAIRESGMFGDPNLAGLHAAACLIATVTVLMGIMTHAHAGAKLHKAVISLLWALGVVYAVFLANSFSRGAWLAATVGIVYCVRTRIATIGRAHSGEDKIGGWMHWKYHRLVVVFTVAVMILGFWLIRDIDNAFLQRLWSIGDPSDFSWRNRIVAVSIAADIVSESYGLGVGWEQMHKVYMGLYADSNSSLALATNDVLMLACAYGIMPAGWVIVHIGDQVRQFEEAGREARYDELPVAVARHAMRGIALGLVCATVCNGILFTLSLGVLFWVAMGMGSAPIRATILADLDKKSMP